MAVLMKQNSKQTVDDFIKVARLANVTITVNDIRRDVQSAPHEPPSDLPEGYMAVYIFVHNGKVLKVGKAGPKSKARYTSQHYNPGSAPSTLAASLLKDADRYGLSKAERDDIGKWMKTNLTRINFLLPAKLGDPVLTLLESFVQCRFRPRYEGRRS